MKSRNSLDFYHFEKSDRLCSKQEGKATFAEAANYNIKVSKLCATTKI